MIALWVVCKMLILSAVWAVGSNNWLYLSNIYKDCSIYSGIFPSFEGMLCQNHCWRYRDAQTLFISTHMKPTVGFCAFSRPVWWFGSRFVIHLYLQNCLCLVTARGIFATSTLHDEWKELQTFKRICSPSKNMAPEDEYFVRRSLSRGIHTSTHFSQIPEVMWVNPGPFPPFLHL